ncbi:MAG: PAS domain S-box protein, partial [Anaerolineales bacterium]|nr:PAS domain S-box protein [Anaerolineales bacterium]
RKNGANFPAEASITKVSSAGKIFFTAILRDITKRKIVEQALRESEKKQSMVLNGVDEIIYQVNYPEGGSANGTVEFVSERTQEILGFRPTDFIADPNRWFNLIHPEDIPAVQAQTTKIFATGQPGLRHYRIKDTNGEYRWMEDRMSPEKDKTGRVVRTFGVARDITERKYAEQQMKELSMAVEQTADCVVITDREGVILYVNAAFEKETGYTREEALGKTPRILKSSEHDPRFYEALWKTILAGNAFKAVFINRKKTGELVYEQKTITPLKDSQGNITHFVSTAKNTTEQVQAEKALRESERQYHDLFESTSDLIQTVAPDGRLLFVNRAWRETLGYTEQELVNLNIDRIVHPEALTHCFETFQQALSGEQVDRIETRFVTKEGKSILVEGSVACRFEASQPMAITCFLRDITERKLAEEALRSHETRFRALVENGSDGIVLMNENTTVAYSSPAVARMLGYSPDEFVGQNAIELLHPDDLSKNLELLGRLLQKPNGNESSQIRFRHKDGNWRWIEATGTNLLKESSVRGIVVNFRDITVRKQAEAELQHRKEDLELINTLNELVNRGERLDKLIDTLSSETRRIFSAHACTVFLLSPDGQVLTIPHLTISPSIIEKLEQMIGQPMPQLQISFKEGGYIQKKLKAEQGVITSDPKLIQQWMTEFAESISISAALRGLIRKLVPQIFKFLNIGSTLTIPLISDNKTFGLLELASTGLYTTDDLTRIRNISGQVTAAILRKQAEEVLRQSEEKYRTLVEQASDGIFIADADGNHIEVNSRGCEMLGYTRAEILQLKISDLLKSGEMEDAPLRLDALRQGKTLLTERTLVRKDGSTFPTEVSVKMIASGGLQAFVRDITERKRAEQQLQTLLEVMPDGVLAVNAEGNIIVANAQIEALFGYRREELLGQPIEMLLPERNRVIHPRHRDGYLAAPKTRTMGSGLELYARRKDGSEFPVDISLSAVETEQGRTAISVIRDITERKRAEEQLHDSEERFRTTFEQAAVGIAHIGTDGGWLRVNQRLCDIVGYTRDELSGLTFQDITHPDDLQTDLNYVHQMLADEIKAYSMEKRYIRKDRSIVWINLTVSLVRETSGEPKYFISVVEDITERKRADAERAQLLSVLESSLNEIYIFDAETLRVQYVNLGALRNLGYTREAMSAMSPLDIKPEFNEDSFRDLLEPLLRLEQEKLIFHTVHRRADGSLYPVEVHLQMSDFEGKRVFHAIILDITERKKVEQEIFKLNAELEQRVAERTTDLNSANIELERSVRVKDEFL